MRQAELDYEAKCKNYRMTHISTAMQISEYVMTKYENAMRLKIPYKHDDNVFTTLHVLVDTNKTKQCSVVPVTMGFAEEYLRDGGQDEYQYYISGKANIYKQVCSKTVWVYGKPNYHRVVDVVNVDFWESMICVMSGHVDDIFVGFTINGVKIDTKTNHRCFRLNKWRTYSDIEYYPICLGYGDEIQNLRIYVINRLCFLGQVYNIDYIDYTTSVYDVLFDYAKPDKPVYRERKKYQALLKKQKGMTAHVETQDIQDTGSSNQETEETVNEPLDNLGYIYLLREREFRLRDEKVYKIGRTIQTTCSLQLRRLKDYKKGSELCLVRQVSSAKVAEIETSIKAEFRKSFRQHADGHEYFYGDMEQMMNIINSVCVQYSTE
jgi:hypothetical protein